MDAQITKNFDFHKFWKSTENIVRAINNKHQQASFSTDIETFESNTRIYENDICKKYFFPPSKLRIELFQKCIHTKHRIVFYVERGGEPYMP